MIRQMHVEEVAERVAANEPVYFLDVRRPDENEYCRLPESVLVPLQELPDRLDEVTPPEGALVVVYCHHGVRSLSGASILQQAGFTNVVSMAGGIEAWSQRIDRRIPRY